jgi:tribbles-like protein
VHEAHAKGIVLRDLKLRKFVFTDETRTEVKLESLEDAVVLEDVEDDLLSDKHGCPAYVSPEILRSNTQYSGRAADMWGLGVMLYTMLVGRYPFHGAEHSGLFAKIRRGQFSLPDSLSSRAKCLIKCLLRKDPTDRISTEDVMLHPWVVGSARERGGSHRRSPNSDSGDQSVPEMPTNTRENSSEASSSSRHSSSSAFSDMFRPASAASVYRIRE